MKRFSIYTLLTLLAVSCTSSFTEVENGSDMIEVFFGQSTTIGSRTSIADDGAASWSKTDKIALWAAKSDGTFALANQTFSLHHYSTTYDRAVFSSKIPNTLTEQSYTYYATYPVPKSVDGNIARFNLPATQNGSRELGSRDIMVARPETGAALVEDEYLNLDLGFTHKMHTLRLQLAESQLNGVAIDKIIIEFPTDVVGDVLVDVTDPNAAPTYKNALDYMTILVPEGYTAGDYIWATIFPTTLSGDIAYRVCAGEYTSKTRTISLNKEAQPQRVTPMSMPIPEPITAVYIAVTDSSNLGEEFHTITIMDANGNTLSTFARNALDEYYLPENVTITSGQALTIGYESENAYVTAKVTAPTIQTGKTHRIESVVPYLLFEDGSGIHTSAEKGDERGSTVSGGVEGTSLDSYMNTAGWSAARFKLVAGQSMRVNVRHESTLGVTRYTGRLDSPAISGIKAGKSVKLQIWFDMGSYANSGYDNNNGVFCMAGVHSNSGTPNGVQSRKAFGNVGDDVSRVSGQFSTVYLQSDHLTNYTNDSFNTTFPTFTYTATGCTSSTRFCWIPCCVQSTWSSSTQAHYYIYLDNIKVKIVK
ncbi:MAG: fimbrillin family protein [Alistipes sp.]|nr:fimbrillin family protein [Alistipes sp.]